MNFDHKLINEFILDATDLIENADSVLLKIEEGSIPFSEGYTTIFNCLHSLKGSLGMFEYIEEMNYIHSLEDWFSGLKGKDTFSADQLDFMSKSILSMASRLSAPDSPLYNPDKAQHTITVETEKNIVKPITSEKTEVTIENETKSSIYHSFSGTESFLQILVVDDDELILDSFTDLFGSRYKLYTVNSVKNATKALEQNPNIQIIFCDLFMPKEKGTKLIEHLQNTQTDLPIIMMSSAAEKKDLIELLKKHTFYFIEKGESFSEIEKALKKALKLRLKQLSDQARKIIIKNKSHNRK